MIFRGRRRGISSGGQHVYRADNVVSRPRKGVHVARMNPFADQSLRITTKLKARSTTVKNHGEFMMEAVRATTLYMDRGKLIVQMKWVGLEEPDMT